MFKVLGRYTFDKFLYFTVIHIHSIIHGCIIKITTTLNSITSLKLNEDTEDKHFRTNTAHITMFSSDHADCSPVRVYR